MMTKPPMRVRLAIASDRSFKRLVNGLRVAHQGIWLGMFRMQDTDAANAQAYADWSKYQDDDYNQTGLATWERNAVEQYFGPGSRVLVPSAGGGRELLGLESLGYRGVGFDPSPVLVESGRQLLSRVGSQAELILSPPDRLPSDLDGRFDAVLFGWGGYVHIRGRSTRVEFLRELRRTIAEGSPLLISFLLRSPGDRTFPATRRFASVIRRARRSDEPIELGDTVAATFDHYFTWEELESELADGGFAVVDSSSAPYPHVIGRAM